MQQPPNKTLLAFAIGLLSFTSTHAASVTWQGGTGNWTDSNWNHSIDGASQSYPTTISDNLTISTGSVSSSTSITSASGGSLANQTLDISGNASLSITGSLDFGAGNGNTRALAFSMSDTSSLTANSLSLKTKNIGLSTLTFGGGTLTLNADNPITGGNFTAQTLNITADAGAFSIFHTNATDLARTLAVKVSQDIFSIDGNRITVKAEVDGTNILALNAELALAENTHNNKYLQIQDGGTNQTLIVVSAVPEPSSTALLGLGGLALILRRRK